MAADVHHDHERGDTGDHGPDARQAEEQADTEVAGRLLAPVVAQQAGAAHDRLQRTHPLDDEEWRHEARREALGNPDATQHQAAEDARGSAMYPATCPPWAAMAA